METKIFLLVLVLWMGTTANGFAQTNENQEPTLKETLDWICDYSLKNVFFDNSVGDAYRVYKYDINKLILYYNMEYVIPGAKFFDKKFTVELKKLSEIKIQGFSVFLYSNESTFCEVLYTKDNRTEYRKYFEFRFPIDCADIQKTQTRLVNSFKHLALLIGIDLKVTNENEIRKSDLF